MGDPVVIGVPYRADARGTGHAADLRLASGAGDGVRAVTLASEALLHESAGGAPAPAAVARIEDVDAVFLPGGPHNHPDMVDHRDRVVATNYRGREAYGQARHEHEEGVVGAARQHNTPLLAVCGGSWRACAASGGTVRQLPPAAREVHAGPMQNVDEHRHGVEVPAGSLLHHVLSSGGAVPGHRPAPAPAAAAAAAPAAAVAAPAAVNLPVNSVHWAVNEPAAAGPIRTTARSTGEAAGHPEAFEDPGLHYFMGVQWHPEYAQEGLAAGRGQGDAAALAEGTRMNARLMESLRQAGRESRAARMIQRNFRAARFRRRLRRAAAVGPAAPAVSSDG